MFTLALIALNLALNTPAAPDPAVFDAGMENQAGLTFSPDGEWLYFVSTRPADAGGPETQGDIWRYRLRAPNHLERLSVNSAAAEYSPVVTSSGALYFASAREGGYGQGDLYRAPPLEGGFAEPEILEPALNHPTGEWNLWVASNEQEIIFEASSRPENVSTPGDLYYTWVTASGWSPAMPISKLNGEGSELLPRLHPNGQQLYYTTAPLGGNAQIATADWPRLRQALRSRHAPDLLVANRPSHDVAVVDLGQGEVTQRIATGEGPHLLSNVEGDRVLATGYGVFPAPHDAPVSRHDYAPVRRFPLADAPLNIVVHPARDLAYVSLPRANVIEEIDLHTGQAIRRIRVGIEPDGLRWATGVKCRAVSSLKPAATGLECPSEVLRGDLTSSPWEQRQSRWGAGQVTILQSPNRCFLSPSPQYPVPQL